MAADERRFDSLTERILQATFEVSNVLGCGLLEKVYERASSKNSLVLELKCVDHLLNEQTAQCLNYLKASGHKLALLINSQRPKVQLKRIVREL